MASSPAVRLVGGGERSARPARFVLRAAVIAVGVILVAGFGGPGKALAASTDWPQYLHGPQHSSVSLATVFTTTNASQAHQLWHFSPAPVSGKPAPTLDASPTVVAGKVFIGSGAGVFYALNASTGGVVWKRSLDTQPRLTCAARGITGTAAVVRDPASGVLTVYATGARYLYALKAAGGGVVWKTMIGPPDPAGQNASYNWSSPTVVGGHIYIGLSSQCDDPLIQGGVEELDQHTGAVLSTWHSVPSGSVGGSVWSSPAASPNGQNVWVSTGNECDPTVNACPAGNQIGDALSIVHLSGSLSRLEGWQAPGAAGSGQDADFGSSPTLFGPGVSPPDVGACNKNGTYYALAASPLSTSPIWADALGAPSAGDDMCLASAIWNGSTGALYAAANTTTVAGAAYGGSIRQISPATGAFLWQRGLPCAALGSPSLDSAGVLAISTYNGCVPSTAKPATYLINASTGAILVTLPGNGSKVFGQPVFAGSYLYVATKTAGLFAYAS